MGIAGVVYLAAFLSFAQALMHEQRFGDDQPFQTEVWQMPRTQRAKLRLPLRPVLIEDLRSDCPECDTAEVQGDADAILLSLRTREVQSSRGALTLVQAYAPEGCGAVGNCRLWAMNSKGAVILRGARGISLSLVPGPSGYPDLVLAEHVSAGERYLRRYRFKGKAYSLRACGWETMGSPGHYHERSVITATSCRE